MENKAVVAKVALRSCLTNFHGSSFGKYRGRILRVTWPALGSNDLNLDQSGTSIQILQEPNAGHVTLFYKITTLTTKKNEISLEAEDIATIAMTFNTCVLKKAGKPITNLTTSVVHHSYS